jgi:ABC-2 type transport system ATP-binding protein
LAEAQDFCSDIAIVDRGQLFAHATPSALIASTPGARNLEEVFIELTGKELRDAL